MKCPHCQNPKTNPRTKKTKQSYPTFYCPKCQCTFNERTGSPFNNYAYPTDIIFLVVLWRLRYKLSLRDLSEMFLARGIEFSHETVRLWEAEFAPSLPKSSKPNAATILKKWQPGAGKPMKRTSRSRAKQFICTGRLTSSVTWWMYVCPKPAT